MIIHRVMWPLMERRLPMDPALHPAAMHLIQAAEPSSSREAKVGILLLPIALMWLIASGWTGSWMMPTIVLTYLALVFLPEVIAGIILLRSYRDIYAGALFQVQNPTPAPAATPPAA